MLNFGQEALIELASSDEMDCVLNAVVGIAGIEAGFSALTAGKVITYANKESIVVGGDLLMSLAKPGQRSRSEERRVKECRSRWSPYH